MGNKQTKLHPWRSLEALPPPIVPVGKVPHAIWLDVSRHYNLRKLHAAQCVLSTTAGVILHRLTNPIFELIYTSAPQSSPWQCTVCPSCHVGTPWFLCWELQQRCPAFPLRPSSYCWCFHMFLAYTTSAVFSNLKSPHTQKPLIPLRMQAAVTLLVPLLILLHHSCDEKPKTAYKSQCDVTAASHNTDPLIFSADSPPAAHSSVLLTVPGYWTDNSDDYLDLILQIWK